MALDRRLRLLASSCFSFADGGFVLLGEVRVHGSLELLVEASLEGELLDDFVRDVAHVKEDSNDI